MRQFFSLFLKHLVNFDKKELKVSRDFLTLFFAQKTQPGLPQSAKSLKYAADDRVVIVIVIAVANDYTDEFFSRISSLKRTI